PLTPPTKQTTLQARGGDAADPTPKADNDSEPRRIHPAQTRNAHPATQVLVPGNGETPNHHQSAVRLLATAEAGRTKEPRDNDSKQRNPLPPADTQTARRWPDTRARMDAGLRTPRGPAPAARQNRGRRASRRAQSAVAER